MRSITSIEFRIVEGGYMSWKATMADEDRPRSYGQVVELRKASTVDSEDLKFFVDEALRCIASCRGMTLDQVKSVDAWKAAGSVGPCPVEMPVIANAAR